MRAALQRSGFAYGHWHNAEDVLRIILALRLATYFNDSLDFLQTLWKYLTPGGRVLVVIGNSVVQGYEVKTDELWADIARSDAVGLTVEGLEVVRKKRVGNSIINAAVRNGAGQGVKLYEAILTLRKPNTLQRRRRRL